MRFRLAAIAVALVVAGAAAPRAPKDAARRAEFEPIPDIDAAHVANPHDHGGKPLCQRCHLPGQAGVAVDPIALCSQCHDAKRMKHPYGVVQPTPPADLPFGAGGRIVCHTCHDPHDVKKHRAGLRVELTDLCLKCHRRHAAKSAPGTK